MLGKLSWGITGLGGVTVGGATTWGTGKAQTYTLGTLIVGMTTGGGLTTGTGMLGVGQGGAIVWGVSMTTCWLTLNDPCEGEGQGAGKFGSEPQPQPQPQPLGAPAWDEHPTTR